MGRNRPLKFGPQIIHSKRFYEKLLLLIGGGALASSSGALLIQIQNGSESMNLIL